MFQIVSRKDYRIDGQGTQVWPLHPAEHISDDSIFDLCGVLLTHYNSCTGGLRECIMNCLQA